MAAAAQMDKFIYNSSTAYEDWPIWRFRFENFLKLIEIDIQKPEGKVQGLQHLIHAGGVAVIKVLRQSDKMDKVTWDELIKGMESYCTPKDKKSALYKFTGTKQDDDEALNDYVIRLKPLAIAGGIQSDSLDNEVLRVIAQHATSMEVKLKCLEEDMTTEKLVSWQTTQERHSQCIQSNGKRLENINYVNNSNGNSQQRSLNQQATQRLKNSQECFNCGGEWPHKTSCPAKGKICEFCNGKNHYARVCKKKKQANAGPSNQHNRAQSSQYTRTNFQRQRQQSNKVYQVNENEDDSKQELFGVFYEWLNSLNDKPNDSSIKSTSN